MERCEHLIIGITQFDIKNLGTTPEAAHRSQVQNNPLTYNQRCEIIAAYLKGKGVNQSQYTFSPFPIEEPEKIKDFIPQDTVCFTTLHHATWNQSKKQKLEAQGFIVEVLLQPDTSTTNDLSATEIRKLIKQNDDNWKHLVPLQCVDTILKSGSYESIRDA